MFADEGQLRAFLLLSVQRALLGVVPAALRAVTCDWQAKEIRIQFVFDGEIADDDRECVQIAGTEVIADFASDWTISEEIIRIDSPANLGAYALAHWAYERKERTT